VKIIFIILAGAIALPCLQAADHYKFDFGAGKIADGYTQVLPTTSYTEERGYGFDFGSSVQAIDRGGNDALRGDFVTSDKPFFFSAALPEGNYNVAVAFGDAAGASTNTVKAESRRLMLEDVRTAPGQFVTRTFTVNVRIPRISSGGGVRLKDREKSYLHWDNKLTIEFNGTRPCVAALEIAPATNAITVYLAGDSTVTDQPREPWNSWGQMLTRFFKSGVAVANHAESGESFKSSIGAHRFEKIFSTLRSGDYLFMQFGHNDMKDRAPDALASYKASLERFVSESLQRGATPVLLTSMERKAGVEHDTLGKYPATVRAVAKEKNVALIDLHAMSRILYRALGPDLGKAFQDGTHHNNYGSYELARCVVEGIRQNKLDLAKFITDDTAPFDPAKPDLVGRFNVPPSPQSDAAKPDGN
jgi:lysophospholipase L1-like esterase